MLRIHYPGHKFFHQRSLCKLPSVPKSRTTGDITGVTCRRCLAIIQDEKSSIKS